MASNFHIESRLKNSADIIRTYNWEILIPGIGSVCDSLKDMEDLVVRARSVNLPQRGTETIESYFMGMKQKFPGRPTFSDSITVTFEEFEDQKISLGMAEWANRIFDTRSNSPTGGTSQVKKKRDIAKEIIIRQYAYDGSPLKFGVHLFNAFISNADEVALDYNANDSVKIPVTFAFDWFEILRSNS